MALRMKKTSTYVAGKRLKSSGGSAGGLKLSTQASGAPPILTGLVFTSTFGPQLITGGESVSFDPFAFATPTLTTTMVDTSWSLVDQFSTPIANGTLPINNLKTLWTTYSLSSGEPYTMTASGITFTITREGG